MTCGIMPWETILQATLMLLAFIGMFVGLLMYLDGYWTPERVYQRWLNGNSFRAIDERHRIRKEK